MNLNRKTELDLVAKKMASQFREELHLTPMMPISIHQTVKLKNIQTLFRPMNDGSSGMAMKVKSEDGVEHLFMLINTNKSLGRQRFTCCHELYHLLFQDSFAFVKEYGSEFVDKDEKEYIADCFASYLILPEDGLERSIPDNEMKKDAISLATLLSIEHKFRCSRTTLLNRLKRKELISSERYDLFATGVINSALSYGFSTELYEKTGKTEFVGDYNIKARSLFDDGKISLTKYEELLGSIGINISDKPDDDGEI